MDDRNRCREAQDQHEAEGIPSELGQSADCIEDPQRDGAQEIHWMGMESTRGGGHQNRYNWVFVTTGIFSALEGCNSNGKP